MDDDDDSDTPGKRLNTEGDDYDSDLSDISITESEEDEEISSPKDKSASSPIITSPDVSPKAKLD